MHKGNQISRLSQVSRECQTRKASQHHLQENANQQTIPKMQSEENRMIPFI